MRRRRASRKDITSNDVYLNSFAVAAAVVYLLLQLINPPAKQSEGEPPPGSMSVYISWDAGPLDVDLWLLAPGEAGPVGFSAKTGTNVALLKDDLGTANDTSPANFENTYVRVLAPGEYIANLHCFKCPTVPVKVDLEVRVSLPGQESKQLVTTTVTLRRNREELTAVRFRLDRDGQMVPGSLHNVFKPLYSGVQ